jgi:precorrin-2 dehydrogenase / sirohydrochlorin ferrochelatase
MSAAPRFQYPVCLDLGGRPCIVVGGGAVAERKIRGLLGAGARVTVVSPALTPGLLALAAEARLHWTPREYRAGDLGEAWLVMIATDDHAVNEEVAAEARARRVWANCADDPERCDFALPAIARRGPLTVAVSTGGASPALAQVAREEIERRLSAEWETLGEVAASVRRELRARGLALEGARWRAALGGDVRALVVAGRADEARRRLRERLGA